MGIKRVGAFPLVIWVFGPKVAKFLVGKDTYHHIGFSIFWYPTTSLHSELWALQPMMVLKRFGKVLLCGARQATVKRSNRIGAVIMDQDGMAIGKMAKLLA